MRDLIRQVVSSYQALNLEKQGQGYVQFTARDPNTQQPVVIKILPKVLGNDPQLAARFRALSQTIRQLNHPNITSVHEVGEKAGLPYIVTRAVEKAQPLVDRINQPWAVDQAADLVMQVGQALEHAYNKGLVHGALSPDAIVIQPDGRVQVNDFGLTQLLDVTGTQLHQAASPFIAPERAAGRAADPRSDVYSLGAILYTLLAHRSPQVVQGQVLAPSRFNEEVPADMDKVLVKALATDPAERYQDVKAMVAALGAVTLLPPAAKAAIARISGPSPAPAGQGQAAPQAGATAGGIRCPRCGTEGQTGRYCRRCGAQLDLKPAAKEPETARQPERPKPGRGKQPEPPKRIPGKPQGPAKKPAAAPASPPQPAGGPKPIQITKIEVGSMEMGKGVEATQTTIATPLAVATGNLAAMFPEPLQMPAIDASSLGMALGDQNMPAMPELPPMPTINWAEMIPPLPKIPTADEIEPGPEGS